VDIDSLVLPQFCIDALLSAIQGPSPPSTSTMPPSSEDERGRLHGLHLTLISALPSLPLPLLSRTLETIRSIILSLPDGDEKRKELIEELFKEILERVGDKEKEVVMRWWCEVREELVGGIRRDNGKGGREESHLPSRL
jgi:hypothetical protein